MRRSGGKKRRSVGFFRKTFIPLILSIFSTEKGSSIETALIDSISLVRCWTFFLRDWISRRSSCNFTLKPSIEMKALRPLNRFQIFFMGDPTVDLRIFMGSVFRPILIHDVDIGVNRNLLSDELQNGFRRGHPSGITRCLIKSPLSAIPLELMVRSPTWRCISLRTFLDHLRIIRSIGESL